MAEAAVKVPVKAEKTEKVEKAAERAAPAVQPLETLRREIDHVFDDFLRGYWRFPFSRRAFDVEPLWRGEIAVGNLPAVDVTVTDDAYKVSAELPGMDEKNIDVKYADGVLTISGEKHEEKEEKKKDYFLSERRYGSFKRSFRVADGVDGDKIEATFKNGILTVNLPKTAEAQKKQKSIPVKKA